MRFIWVAGAFLLLALACNPASGFKPNCDCADMGGQWITSRELYENGQPTNQITKENMVLQTDGCSARGTLGAGGSIFGSFAGGVANNLLGKWSLGEDMGTFNIQLLSGDKDCANFEGWITEENGKKEWKWTGHKEAINTQSPCEGECKGRDPHQLWNGKDEYPYCNCVCESGWEFDANGVNCVRIQSPGSDENNAQIQLTTSRGTTTIKPGEKTTNSLTAGNSMKIEVICDQAKATVELMDLIYDDVLGDRLIADSLQPRLNLSAEQREAIFFAYAQAMSIWLQCLNLAEPSGTASNFDIVPASSTGGSPVEITLELQEGPIRADVANDQVALNIETPSATVSSQGKNAFGVAYNPASGTSYVAAYQYPVQVQPANEDQAPFTLESGQEVEVGNGQVEFAAPFGEETAHSPGFVPEDPQGGCYADPMTGEIVCVDSYGVPVGPEE